MRPPGEYVELLEEMSQSWTEPRRPEPVVLALVGVAEPPEATVYAPSADEDFQREYGIGPGCEGPDGPALPPVRVREYVERAGGTLSSICAEDFSAPMSGLAESLAAMAPSMCMPWCVADVEPEVEGLQVECHVDVESWRADGRLDRFTLTRCDGDESEPVLPPDELMCWYPKTGPRRAPACVDEGRNLEFGLLWGETRPAFSQLVPSCRQVEYDQPCPEA